MFVDGCFWHGCPCKTIPATNAAFWKNKIRRNKERDRRVDQQLRKEGWVPIRVWECAVSSRKTLTRIKRVLTNRMRSLMLS